MNNLFMDIKQRNLENGAKQVMSIRTDSGDARTYTYDAMFAAAAAFMARLVAGGVRKGDRVVIAAENSPEWNIAYLAVMQLECTAVLIDFSLPTAELLHLIDVSDARCIFTSPKVGEKVGDAFPHSLPVLNILSDAAPMPGYAAALAPDMPATPDGDPEIAFIIFSSGTTKTASGIQHTHAAMLGTTQAAIDYNHLKSDEKMLVVIPNSHIYGVVTSMLGPLLLGGSMHFIESMTAENVLAAFAEFKPTVFSCVPRVFEMFEKQIVKKINANPLTATVFKLFFPLCVAVRRKTGFNLGKVIFGTIHKGFGGAVRILCAAGAPMNPDTVRFYYGVGMNLFLNYGLTETNVPIIANGFDNYTTDTCGKPYPGVDIKLQLQEQSDLGEIWVKTPFMMRGYFRDDAATKDAFDAQGWFKTGDLATQDAAGNLAIVGRCKDNIVLSTGKKVTPDDIETAYAGLAGVKEFVVCGVPAPDGHDEVHAFVVCDDDGDAAQQAVAQAIHRREGELSQYMKIATLHFVADIPKTSLQKPKRYLLKTLALDENTAVCAPAPIVEHTEDSMTTLVRLVRQVSKTEREILPQTRIFEDLNLDSLSCIELDMLIEQAFGKSIASGFKPLVSIAQLAQDLDAPDSSILKPLFEKDFPAEKKWFDYTSFKFYNTLVRLVYKVEITGLENLPQTGNYLLCSNHETNFDFLWVTLRFSKQQFQKLGCLAKKELFNTSLASKILVRVCGMIPIDRGCQNFGALSLCRQKIREGWSFLVYPEGTRTQSGEMGTFKKGAATLAVSENVPIVPVKIKGGFAIFPTGCKLPKLFDFKHMRRLRVQVAFGAPLSGANTDADNLNQKLRDVISVL
ncbi:MAG: AMP-binding protein [Ruthenibacterium sp.]